MSKLWRLALENFRRLGSQVGVRGGCLSGVIADDTPIQRLEGSEVIYQAILGYRQVSDIAFVQTAKDVELSFGHFLGLSHNAPLNSFRTRWRGQRALITVESR